MQHQQTIAARLARVLSPWALAAVVVVAASPARSQAKATEAQTIKCGSIAPEGTPWADWIQGVKKRIEKETNGKIKLKIFLGGKLGGENEMVADTKKGTLQMFGGSSGALASQLVPEVGVFELPYLFTSDAEVDFVLNRVRGDVEKLMTERGFVFAMWAENGWHGYGVKGKCVPSPDDLKGLKMRSQESSIHVETYRAFGAAPVEVPGPEVLPALQTGAVDGFSQTPLYTFAASWHGSITHYTYTRHIYQPALIVYSKKWFDTLPDDVKPALLNRAEEKVGFELVRALTNPLLDNLKAAGKTVCDLTPTQIAAYEAKAKPVWDVFAKKTKGNKKILDAVLAAKAEYKKLGK